MLLQVMIWRSFLLTLLLITGIRSNQYIIVHPNSTIVTMNSTVTLQCRVTPMKNIKVQWVKDGFGLGDTREDIRLYGQVQSMVRYDLPKNLNEGQYDLQITNVELTDEGRYSCQTSINNKAFTSRIASLQVLVASGPPKLTQIMNEGQGDAIERFDGSSIVVDNGKLMVLRCQANGGRPGAVLTWSIGNEVIQKDSRGNFNGIISGNITHESEKDSKQPKVRNNISLLTSKVNQLLNGKVITCIATNKGYENFNLPVASAKIEIHIAPIVSMEILPKRAENEFMENSWITVTCTATGRPTKYTWKWFINDKEVDGNSNKNSYKFRAERSMNKAVVKCSAFNNKEGYSQRTFTVKYGPQFVDTQPSLYPASIGDDIQMSCQADSNPPPSLYWQRESSNDILSHGSILYRRNVQEMDFGTYVCTANAENFTPIFKKIYLAKRSKPFISDNPDRTAIPGKPIQIRCAINSVPEPQANHIIWYHKSRRIFENSKYSLHQEKFLGGTTSILKINNVESVDFGQYNCTVTTDLGFDSNVMNLTPTSQMPLILIVGGTVFVTMVMLIVIIIICVCKRGACNKKYQKGSPVSRNNICQDPIKNAHLEMDYQCQPALFQWIPTNQRDQQKSSFVRYTQDIDDRSSIRNGSLTQYRGLDMCSTYTSSIPGSQNGEKPARNSDMDDLYKDEICGQPNSTMICSMHGTQTGNNINVISRTSPCNIHPYSPPHFQQQITLPQYSFTSYPNATYLPTYNANFPLPMYPVRSPSSEPGLNCSSGSIIPPLQPQIDIGEQHSRTDICPPTLPSPFPKEMMSTSNYLSNYLSPNIKPKQNPYNFPISSGNLIDGFKSRTLDRKCPISSFNDQTTNL